MQEGRLQDKSADRCDEESSEKESTKVYRLIILTVHLPRHALGWSEALYYDTQSKSNIPGVLFM